MSNNVDAYQAGVDAINANNALTRGEFADAIRTVVTAGFSDAEAKEWTDAIAAEYFLLGISGAATYASLRTHIKNAPGAAVLLFEALGVSINQLPETHLVNQSLMLSGLRVERDEVNTSIDAMTGFKTGATKQVKEALNLGIDQLRGYKESVRDQIRAITGDPDSTQ